MQIHEVTISDVKRVKFVNFKPQSDKLTVIGGKNGQGKSSSLHAIAFALGGEPFRPSNLQREGAEEYPYIKVEMDNGLVLERKGKNSDLTITDPTGKLGGQAILNKVLTKLALNLSEFINSNDKEKCKYLLQIVEDGDLLLKIDEEEQTLYMERRELYDRVQRKKKAAEEMPHYLDVGLELIQPTELLAKQNWILTRNAEVKAAKAKVEANKMALKKSQQTILALDDQKTSLEKQIEGIKRQIELTESQMKTAVEEAKVLEKIVKDSENQAFEEESLDEVKRELAEFSKKNEKIQANILQKKCMEEADALELQYKELTVKIEDARNRKQELLAKTNLPYPGLSVNGGRLTLNGKYWDCMSGSEQITIACALISRLKPDCRFILVDKLEQYDEDQLAGLDKWCEDNQFQIIGTRVSTGDENSLIIQDGLVLGAEPVMVKPVVGKRKTEVKKVVVKAEDNGESHQTNENGSVTLPGEAKPKTDADGNEVLSDEEIRRAERLAKLMKG